jgi:hypothetical protein
MKKILILLAALVSLNVTGQMTGLQYKINLDSCQTDFSTVKGSVFVVVNPNGGIEFDISKFSCDTVIVKASYNAYESKYAYLKGKSPIRLQGIGYKITFQIVRNGTAWNIWTKFPEFVANGLAENFGVSNDNVIRQK